MKTPSPSRLSSRRLLLAAGGIGLATLAAACGADAAAPAKSIAAAPAAVPPVVPTDAPAAAAEPDPATEAPAPAGNLTGTSEAAPVADAAPTPTAPPAPAFPRPAPYNPDDRDSIKVRYSEDSARFEAVLAAGVPVLWVTDAIW
jgi:hypothetical protein